MSECDYEGPFHDYNCTKCSEREPKEKWYHLRPYQACRSTEGWAPVIVESESNPNVSYRVDVNPWGTVNENLCECPAYIYRGHCKHQQIASDRLCGWSDESAAFRGSESQTEDQAKQRICPRCGGATRWEMEVIYAND